MISFPPVGGAPVSPHRAFYRYDLVISLSHLDGGNRLGAESAAALAFDVVSAPDGVAWRYLPSGLQGGRLRHGRPPVSMRTWPCSAETDGLRCIAAADDPEIVVNDTASPPALHCWRGIRRLPTGRNLLRNHIAR